MGTLYGELGRALATSQRTVTMLHSLLETEIAITGRNFGGARHAKDGGGEQVVHGAALCTFPGLVTEEEGEEEDTLEPGSLVPGRERGTRIYCRLPEPPNWFFLQCRQKKKRDSCAKMFAWSCIDHAFIACH